jgi:hypothetical protein
MAAKLLAEQGHAVTCAPATTAALTMPAGTGRLAAGGYGTRPARTCSKIRDVSV